MASNPYLIVRRIMDKGKLWGVKIKYQNEFYKMTKDRLRETIAFNIKDVLVDMKKGDSPVTLVTYGEDSFRTNHDGHICNNFNRLKAIKKVSANKLRIKR